jgi:hypothetical protein
MLLGHQVPYFHYIGKVKTDVKKVALEDKGYNGGVGEHLGHICLEVCENTLDL